MIFDARAEDLSPDASIAAASALVLVLALVLTKRAAPSNN